MARESRSGEACCELLQAYSVYLYLYLQLLQSQLQLALTLTVSGGSCCDGRLLKFVDLST